MRYRVTQSIEDMHRVVDLELAVWGLNSVDAVPVNVLAMTAHNGGVVIVAEDETAEAELVGFAIGFPARRNDKWLLWSHITGVSPQHQGKGIGRALKFKQREWAAQVGYDEVGWTFDPMQPGNANFNLNVLGAVALRYYPNFYGRMTDGINNKPLPSDRLEARWAVRENDMSVQAARIPSLASIFLVEQVTGQSVPRLLNIEAEGITNSESLAIQLPVGVPNANLEGWQLAIRQAFQEALLIGYQATRFVREPNRSYYVLTR
jgi:predicted GNAT superfamily acetyltransferase